MLANVADIFVLNINIKKIHECFSDRNVISHPNFSFEDNIIITMNIIPFSQSCIDIIQPIFFCYQFFQIRGRCNDQYSRTKRRVMIKISFYILITGKH